MTPETTTVETLELGPDERGRSVAVAKVETRNGERVEVAAGDATNRLDALALESLTWQDDDAFADLTGRAHEPAPGTDGDAVSRTTLGNEYAVVHLRLFETEAGRRLELASPKLGYSCRLDAGEVSALARTPTSFFSGLLETPYGPVADDEPLH